MALMVRGEFLGSPNCRLCSLSLCELPSSFCSQTYCGRPLSSTSTSAIATVIAVHCLQPVPPLSLFASMPKLSSGCGNPPNISRYFLHVSSTLVTLDVDKEEDEEEIEEEDDYEDDGDQRDEKLEVRERGREGVVRRSFRLLGNKEKKELRAYAHQLGKDICVHQVGKWGVTSTVITAISDALEANELIKVRVLDNCSDELDDTVRELEDKTEAQIVGHIGRTLLLYRPSLCKLAAAQAAQEKSQARPRRSRLGMSTGQKPKSSCKGASKANSRFGKSRASTR